MSGHLLGLIPACNFTLGLVFIEAYLEGRCWQGLSPQGNAAGARALLQTEGGSKGVDAETLFGLAASGQHGGKEAHCAPRSALLRGRIGQRQNPAWPLLSVSLAQNFVASMGTAP